MSVEQENNNDRQRRAKRVRFLKKIIMVSILLAIVFPTFLSVILVIRVNSLERRMESLYEEKADMDTQQALNQVGNDSGASVTEMPEQTDLSEQTEDKSGMAQQRRVYLTFDDGPSINTGTILDILKEKNVKATFFVVGKESKAAQDSYKRIVQEGHTLGMHSYSHKYDEIYESLDSYRQDLLKLQDYLFEVTGVKSSYVRFPGGSSNSVSKTDMKELVTFLEDEQITYFDWNISSGDAANAYISKEEIVNNCIDHINEYTSSVILLHDSTNKLSTVEALPLIIDRLQEQDGFEILPITDDTPLIRHVIK